MARTALTPKTAPGSYPALPVSANALDLTMTAADVANKNQFPASGNDLIVAQNSGASPYTLTLTSSTDEKGRTGDITTYSLDASDIIIIGPLRKAGWAQADGNIYLEASNAAVKLAVVAL